MALEEPLTKARAKDLALAILESGFTRISAHALDEMDADGLDGPDLLDVLEQGWVDSWTSRLTSSSPSVQNAHSSSSPHGGAER